MAGNLKPAPEPLPGLLRRTSRRAYRMGAGLTASLRLEPGFIMIGAQRCGTTTLFQALAAHPQVIRPRFRKGVNYFDLNYYRGRNWYLGHFPIAGAARRAASHGEPVAFEASGYYLYHPFAVGRLSRDLPASKLVVMLRDPVERAFSAYKHEYVRGYEPVEVFEKALELEDERLAGEIDRMRDDSRYESIAHRHHSYKHRGHYAEQLERVFGLFPRDQVYVVESEAFFEQPGQEYRRLLAFLGLSPFEPASFGRHKGHASAAMTPATRRMLEEYYAPHNEQLAMLLGRTPRWVGDNRPPATGGSAMQGVDRTP